MSGSPIINLNNFRVIGVHKASHSTKNMNIGIFIREPIKNFYEFLSKENSQKEKTILQIFFESWEFNENIDILKEKCQNNKEFEELKNLNKIFIKVIYENFKIPKKMLDSKGNKINGWSIGEKRGGFNYEPPLGYIGFGLNVNDKYDDNNEWLGCDGNTNEWAVAYYPITNPEIIKIIISGGFIVSSKTQYLKDDEDINHPGKIVGSGIYCSPIIHYLNFYYKRRKINIEDKNYKVILMLRVKPEN